MSAHRLRWNDLPDSVRTQIESLVGARVVGAQSGAGGYSPSFASRCDLDNGRRVFVKAVSPAQNPESPDMLRSEIDATQRLPSSVPAPRLLHSMDDGNWIVGVFEFVDGRTPGSPWVAREVSAVVDAVNRLGGMPLTESLRGLPTAEDRLATTFGGWKIVTDSPSPFALDEWATEHLDDLVALESRWRDAVSGESLVHLDVRSDNILIEPTGRVVLVDWPHACIGAPWLDLVVMIPSLVLEGGGEPEPLLERFGISADGDAIDVVVAACAGLFAERGGRPDPPGLPTVRAFQRAQGKVALRWLRTRLGDPSPQ
jgi:hypothetical protein